MPWMDLVPERGRTPDPRPGDRLAALLPDPEPPLALATRVLEAHPGDVADVVLHVRALEPPELADERLHATRLCEGVRHSANCAYADSNTSRGCAPRMSRRPSSTKAGIPVDAERVRLAGRSTHAVGIRVAREHLLHLRAVEAGLDGERKQLRRVADVPAFLPVGGHQPVVDGSVEPSLSRELGDAQRSHRVRDDVGVRAVDEAIRLEHPSHPVYARLAVALEQSLSRQAFLRVLRMEIEGEPRDLRAEPALEPVGRRLADAAERSDVVGPDEDFVLAHSGSSRRMSSTVSRRRMTRASPSATSTAAGRGTAL